MKYAIAAFSLVLAADLAQAQESCAGKEAEINRQLEHAREHGNDRRARGLEAALKEVRTHCTDAGLQAERQGKIDEARDEVAERKADLREALEDGPPEKIEKRQRKLTEAQDELRESLKD